MGMIETISLKWDNHDGQFLLTWAVGRVLFFNVLHSYFWDEKNSLSYIVVLLIGLKLYISSKFCRISINV